MAEYAKLIIEADTKDVSNAVVDLDELTVAARDTEKATKGLTGKAKKLTEEFNRQQISTTKGKDSVELYDAALSGATAEELKAIKAIQEKKRVLRLNEQEVKSQADAVKAAAKAQSLAVKEQAAAFDRAEKEAHEYNTALNASKSANLQAQEAAKKQQLSLVNARVESAKTQTVMSKMTNSFKVQKGVVQQAGYQVGDFAVQVAGGQGAMRAFTQQAPQFLGAFGPGGAVLGAVVAIAGAFAGALIPSLLKSEDAMEVVSAGMTSLRGIIVETKDDTLVLTDAFAKLTKENKQLSEVQVKEALLATRDALKSANKEAINLVNSLNPANMGDSTGRFDHTASLMRTLRREFVTGKIDLAEFNKETEKLFIRQEDPSKAFREMRKEISALNTKTIEATKLRDRLLEGTDGLESKSEDKEAKEKAKEAEEAAKALRKSEQAKIKALEDSFRTEQKIIEDNYDLKIETVKTAERLGLDTDASFKELRGKAQLEYFDKMNALDNKKLLEEQSIADKKALIKKQELAAMQGFFAMSATALSEGFGEQNVIARAAFATQKLLALPAMKVATLKGATAALELGPIAGPIASGAIKAMGYASMGAVAGTALSGLAGRAQGGQVRAGGEYLVGEFGPEVLTMGPHSGSITPNNKMGGSSEPVSVVNNIKVIGGSSDQKVTSNTTQVGDRKFVTDIIISELSNTTGKVGRTLTTKYNTSAKGR